MKKYLIAVVALVLGGIAYYGISPLFRNVKVDEALPTAGSMATEVDGVAAAPVMDTPAHPASGTARVVSADGKQYLRYEDYKTINGPDLYVYLSKDPEAKEFVNLGRLKATEGNVNYEIPEGVDPRDYPYALTWCKQFGVLFNSAKLY